MGGMHDGLFFNPEHTSGPCSMAYSEEVVMSIQQYVHNLILILASQPTLRLQIASESLIRRRDERHITSHGTSHGKHTSPWCLR